MSHPYVLHPRDRPDQGAADARLDPIQMLALGLGQLQPFVDRWDRGELISAEEWAQAVRCACLTLSGRDPTRDGRR